MPSNAKRNNPDWLNTGAPSLPRFLRRAGYATAHFGKWHLANNMIPDSPLPSAYGYDEYGAFNCAGEQMPVHEDSARAIAFIEESVEAGKPFFIAGYQADGVSQLAALKGKAAPSREKPLYWKMKSSWPAPKGRPDHWVAWAVVDQNWKLVSNPDGSHCELFDLATDPLEKNDLKEEKAGVVENLKKQLESWRATLPEKPSGDVFSALRKQAG